ncbi:MAG: VOC family protein [Verrucomicrobiota bacterium]
MRIVLQRLLFALAIAGASVLHAAVQSVGAIGITVGDLDRAVQFYTQVLPFEQTGTSEARGKELETLTGIASAHTKTVHLKLGGESISLTQWVAPKGRPIPADSRSTDHWFQHIAIVVSDMDKAYAHLAKHKVRHVSTAPQTLPAWNPNAGGIKAFYFRDPEDHVLEIIWFPRGKGDPQWQRPTDRIFLGIDHTAIVVSDTDSSLAFYRDVLGMKVAGASENFGVEQEHLNQVFGARLRITAVRAEKGPGIEFLEYIAPPGGRALPAEAKANDLVCWRTPLHVKALDELAARLRESQTQFISTPASKPGAILVRDPDGHALELQTTKP